MTKKSKNIKTQLISYRIIEMVYVAFIIYFLYELFANGVVDTKRIIPYIVLILITVFCLIYIEIRLHKNKNVINAEKEKKKQKQQEKERGDYYDKLEKLNDLKEKGIITGEEFEKEKQKIKPQE